jgi:hypothetical protein
VSGREGGNVLHDFQKDDQAAETEDQARGDAKYNHSSISKSKITRHDILLSRVIGRQARAREARPLDSFTLPSS